MAQNADSAEVHVARHRRRRSHAAPIDDLELIEHEPDVFGERQRQQLTSCFILLPRDVRLLGQSVHIDAPRHAIAERRRERRKRVVDGHHDKASGRQRLHLVEGNRPEAAPAVRIHDHREPTVGRWSGQI